jgi:hypothetical protein
MAMRYRLHINRAEYLLALIPFGDGISQLLQQESRTYDGIGSLWHIVLPYILLSTPLILFLQYLYSYVELTPSSLEYQALGRHRSISYGEMERIDHGATGLDRSGGGTTQIYGYGMKRLDLKLEHTAEFIAELRQYAPQAFLGGSDFSLLEDF